MLNIQKEIKKDFINFLKTNRAYSAFKRNRINKKPLRATIGTNNLLLSSFQWGTSPEGYEYWFHLNMKWQRYCIRNYKTKEVIEVHTTF